MDGMLPEVAMVTSIGADVALFPVEFTTVTENVPAEVTVID